LNNFLLFIVHYVDSRSLIIVEVLAPFNISTTTFHCKWHTHVSRTRNTVTLQRLISTKLQMTPAATQVLKRTLWILGYAFVPHKRTGIRNYSQVYACEYRWAI
jgi:hypothetical protein